MIHRHWPRDGEIVESEHGKHAAEREPKGLGMFQASWPTELETGVPILDEQHRLLDRVLLSLHQSLKGTQPPRDLGARVDQLQCLAQEHFATEEAVMETCAYPHLQPHRAEHGVFVERLHEMLRLYSRPEAPTLVELVERIREMLLIHVRDVDLDYADYLRESLGFKPLH